VLTVSKKDFTFHHHVARRPHWGSAVSCRVQSHRVKLSKRKLWLARTTAST